MCAVTPRGTVASVATPRLELADIVRVHGDVYRHTHRLAKVQAVALRAIERCRTAALGGHRETCDRCGAVRLRYHSCGNRHCPKCQTLTKERWLAARKADLLPIPYFHVVFTLPHALNALAQGNPRVVYALLFRAAADTLLAFGRDPTHLGGTIGVTAILHTWGQNLSQHLHLRGFTHVRLNQSRQALVDAEQCVRSYPDDAKGYLLRGVARSGLGDAGNALRDFDRSISLDSLSDLAFVSRAITYYQQGQYAEALHDYDRAIAWVFITVMKAFSLGL